MGNLCDPRATMGYKNEQVRVWLWKIRLWLNLSAMFQLLCEEQKLWLWYVSCNFQCVFHLTKSFSPSKTFCCFLQYTATKPDKFGITLCVACDLKSKYIDSVLPYLGTDPSCPSGGRLSENVVMRLMDPLWTRAELLPRTISWHCCHLHNDCLAQRPLSLAQSTRSPGEFLNRLHRQTAMNSPLRYVADLLCGSIFMCTLTMVLHTGTWFWPWMQHCHSKHYKKKAIIAHSCLCKLSL